MANKFEHPHHKPGDIHRTASFENRFSKLARGEKEEPSSERKQKAIERMNIAGESQYVSLRQQYGMDPGVPDHLESDQMNTRRTWKGGEENDANPKAGEGPLYNTMNPYAPDATVIDDGKGKKNEIEKNDFGARVDNSSSFTDQV
jgi:hypothetical protein